MQIKLHKRVKYAGDVYTELLKAGWDCETAALFCDNILDADTVEVVRCKDCSRRYDADECPMCVLIDGEYYEYTNGNGFCDRGERRVDHEP